MRIALDIRRINLFGIGTYIWNLVRNLAAVDNHNTYSLAGTNRDFHELGPLPPNFSQLYCGDDEGLWSNHVAFPLSLKRNGVDLLHVPHRYAPLWVPARMVVTVHDCTHLLYPPQDSTRFQNYRKYWYTKKVIERADHVLTVSQSTKDDLVHILGAPESKVSVIHNALDERFVSSSENEREQREVLERYQLKDPFILYAGNIKPHKNIDRLIEAFAVLKNELVEDPRFKHLKLIIIGDELSRHQYLRLTVIRSGAQQDVRFFGFVPYPILRIFYQTAELFAFPSLYEGFGLPPLEAMANRTPVIASNSSSLPEVLNGAAILINPENVFEIARGMKQILLDADLRARLIGAGEEQVRKFSWKAAAEKVVGLYEAVATASRSTSSADSFRSLPRT